MQDPCLKERKKKNIWQNIGEAIFWAIKCHFTLILCMFEGFVKCTFPSIVLKRRSYVRPFVHK